MESDYDLLVVGAGPGGYVCAIRAAQLGMRVAVVEREELGGVCLNWGCIPSKTLLKNAEYISILSKGEEFGFSFDNLRIDYSKAYERSRNVVERQIRGVSYLLRKNNVEHVQGDAVLRDAHTIEVAPEGRVLRGRNVVLATGARPRSIPSLPIDGETCDYKPACLGTAIAAVIGGYRGRGRSGGGVRASVALLRRGRDLGGALASDGAQRG